MVACVCASPRVCSIDSEAVWTVHCLHAHHCGGGRICVVEGYFPCTYANVELTTRRQRCSEAVAQVGKVLLAKGVSGVWGKQEGRDRWPYCCSSSG